MAWQGNLFGGNNPDMQPAPTFEPTPESPAVTVTTDPTADISLQEQIRQRTCEELQGRQLPIPPQLEC